MAYRKILVPLLFGLATAQVAYAEEVVLPAANEVGYAVTWRASAPAVAPPTAAGELGCGWQFVNGEAVWAFSSHTAAWVEWARLAGPTPALAPDTYRGA
jgi:hypothetical protein